MEVPYTKEIESIRYKAIQRITGMMLLTLICGLTLFYTEVPSYARWIVLGATALLIIFISMLSY